MYPSSVLKLEYRQEPRLPIPYHPLLTSPLLYPYPIHSINRACDKKQGGRGVEGGVRIIIFNVVVFYEQGIPGEGRERQVGCREGGKWWGIMGEGEGEGRRWERERDERNTHPPHQRTKYFSIH